MNKCNGLMKNILIEFDRNTSFPIKIVGNTRSVHIPSNLKIKEKGIKSVFGFRFGF